MEAICISKSIQVQLASLSCMATNQVLYQPGETLRICVTVVSQNLSPDNNILVEKSLAACAMFRTPYPESAYALHWFLCSCGRNSFVVQINDCWNLDFCHPRLLISLTGRVDRDLPSLLYQFVKLYLLLLNTVHVLLYRCGDCALHLVKFLMFAYLAQHCMLFLIFPILVIVRACKITQNVSNSIQHFLKCFILAFRLSIPDFEYFSYLPTHSQLLSMRLQLAFLPQLFLYR